jgi:CubicO group peptidase (beta-lactamase class C family)
MNKMFTSVGILQLVQAGKISLRDTVGKYIPNYPKKEIATKVTIKQLLTHAGSTGDIFGPQFDAHRLELRTLNDYVDLFGQRAPQFEPGARWMYSNYGFVLLGVVIEHVTGESYYDYVHEKIFTPAGMTSTGSLPEDQPLPQRSVGYTKHIGVDELQPNPETLPYRGSSAGGGYSTVGDLLQFANALQSGKLLNPQSISLLTTGRIDMPRGTKNALGFVETDGDRPTRHFGHGGDAAGINGDLKIYPKTGYGIVVLSNIDPPSSNRISSFIQNRLPAS